MLNFHHRKLHFNYKRAISGDKMNISYQCNQLVNDKSASEI